MKVTATALALIFGSASANLPSLSINVKDGSFDGIGGLEPTLNWSASAASGDVDLEYGIEAEARPTTDIASLPKNIWGKAKTSINGWGVAARAEFAGIDFSKADVEVDANNDEGDLSLHLEASAGSDGFDLEKVELKKSFDNDDGAHISVNPRYDVGSEEADVVIAYDNDGTNVELTASQEEQSITVSRQIDDDNRVAPTFASSRKVSVEWERNLGDDNTLTTTLKPDDSIDLEWKDDSWTANINLPLDGTDVTGANVNIKREVNF